MQLLLHLPYIVQYQTGDEIRKFKCHHGTRYSFTYQMGKFRSATLF